MPCRKIELEQGTAEWLAWRENGIGGSEAPTVLGYSPYQKPFQLFEEKSKRKHRAFKENPAMARGHELEPLARRKFAALYNLSNDTEETFDPCCLEDETLPFLRVSLDGLSSDGKHVIEIKYQGKEPHAAAKRGEIRKHHLAQVQYQMLVSGAEYATYVSIGDDETIHAVPVFADPVFQEMLVSLCSEFWRQVLAGKWDSELAPSEPAPADVREPARQKADVEYKATDAGSIGHLFEQYEMLGAEIKELEDQREQLKIKILGTGVKECGPYRVTEVERQGAVDWAKLQEKFANVFAHAGIEPEAFRKKSTKYPQIKRDKS